MLALWTLLVGFIRNRFRSTAEIEAENTALRQQIGVLLRTTPRVHLRASDRMVFVLLYRLFPSILSAIAIVQPETVVGLASRGVSGAVALEIQE